MKRQIVISSDSTCDLSKELIERYQIRILPMGVSLGDNIYRDGVDITPDDIYWHNAQTGQLPKTSAINMSESADFFAELTKDGSAVIHFTISSAMSATYNNARVAAEDFENVYVHCFLDGRDRPPASAEGYITELENKIAEKGVGKIATLSGRFFAMDRDKRWERVSQAYNAMVKGEGEKHISATAAIEESYQKEVFDEFVKPTVITNKSGEPIATIKSGDSVIFFNFRPDRAREITRAIVDKEFDGFETKNINTYFVCMTPYDETMPNVEIAYRKEEIRNTFGEYISRRGLKQLRIAETEKYAHVTFFFNGGEEKQYEGEDRILVPSPKVETYDLKPENHFMPDFDSIPEDVACPLGSEYPVASFKAPSKG